MANNDSAVAKEWPVGELDRLPPGSFVFIAWSDIYGSLDGDPSEVETFLFDCAGWWHGIGTDKRGIRYGVISSHRAENGDDTESGGQAVPLGCISRALVVSLWMIGWDTPDAVA